MKQSRFWQLGAAWILFGAFVAAQIFGSLLWSVVALASWLMLWHLRKSNFLRRLWKPPFWIATGVIVLLSGFFLGHRDLTIAGMGASSSGIQAGAEMLLRAVFVFSMALVLSDALNAEGFEKLQRRTGFPHFWLAVRSAMEMLPALTSRAGKEFSAESGARRLPRRGVLLRWMKEAVRIAEGGEFRLPHLPLRQPVMLAITGARNSGKTTYLTQLNSALKGAGVLAGGILQPATVQGEIKVRYDVLELATGHRKTLAERKADSQNGYDFSEDTFRWSGDVIAAGAKGCAVLFVDELGLLEAQGEGHLPNLRQAAEENRAPIWIAAVREECLESLGERLPFLVVPVVVWNTPPAHLAESIARHLESLRNR